MTRRRAILYGAAATGLLASGLAGGVALDRRLRTTAVPSFRRLTFRRGAIRSARVAPDGETILYGALWDGDRCRVHTVRVDGPESRPLDLPDGNVLAISRSGEIAMSLGRHDDGTITYGTLARVPMAGGAPRQVIEGVRFADWSPDGADLAIVRSVNGIDQLEFPIGKILFKPTLTEGTGLGFPRISPDGTHVAFVHYRHPLLVMGHVSIVDRSGVVTKLSVESNNIHGLTWRGKEIVYSATDDTPLFRAVWGVIPGGPTRLIARTLTNITVWDALPNGRLVAAQTDDRTIVAVRLRGEDSDRDMSWLDASALADLSADGKQLLFTEQGQGGGPESATYLRGTDGSAAVRLGAGYASALSPDGRWAISTSMRLPSPYLELLPTGAGEPRRIQDEGLAYFGARWLPDSKRAIVAAREPNRWTKLFVHRFDSGTPQAITPEGIAAWVVSPDGSIIAATGPSPTIQLYDVAGSAPRTIPGLTGSELPVGWITEGLLVMHLDASSPLGQIYRIDTKTGVQEPWKNILTRDHVGILGRPRLSVTPDGESYAYGWHRALSSLYIADGLV